MILVLPSGSVFVASAGNHPWPGYRMKHVLTMSMSSMSYQLMLWALCVTDSPLDHEHDLDLEHLPLLGRWHLSGPLPWFCVLSLWRPLSWLTFDLQHELKMIFVTTFMALFVKHWAILVCMCRVTFTTHFISAMFISCYLCVNCLLRLSCYFYCPSYRTFETFNCIDSRRLGWFLHWTCSS